MTTKPKLKANIGMVLLPHREILPPSVAASVGKTVARFSLMEAEQIFIMSSLLGISIKQGRIVLRLNRTNTFVRALRQLLTFLQINVTIGFKALTTALENADAARNALAHSVYMDVPGTKRLRIQLTSGTWDLDDKYEPVSRALTPQGKDVSRAFLMSQRADVEKALKLVRQLRREIDAALRTLNEKRRTEPELNRRTPQT